MVRAWYVCVTIIYQTLDMDHRIFIVRTDVMHAIAHRGCTDTERESALKVDWEENPLPHRGIKPASVAWWSDAVANWATSPPHLLHTCSLFGSWIFLSKHFSVIVPRYEPHGVLGIKTNEFAFPFLFCLFVKRYYLLTLLHWRIYFVLCEI